MDPKILKEQKDEHGYLMNEIINDFKKKTKDPFVLQLLNTQIINNYLFAWLAFVIYPYTNSK